MIFFTRARSQQYAVLSVFFICLILFKLIYYNTLTITTLSQKTDFFPISEKKSVFSPFCTKKQNLDCAILQQFKTMYCPVILGHILSLVSLKFISVKGSKIIAVYLAGNYRIRVPALQENIRQPEFFEL